MRRSPVRRRGMGRSGALQLNIARFVDSDCRDVIEIAITRRQGTNPVFNHCRKNQRIVCKKAVIRPNGSCYVQELFIRTGYHNIEVKNPGCETPVYLLAVVIPESSSIEQRCRRSRHSFEFPLKA